MRGKAGIGGEPCPEHHHAAPCPLMPPPQFVRCNARPLQTLPCPPPVAPSVLVTPSNETPLLELGTTLLPGRNQYTLLTKVSLSLFN